ncbi:MAG: PQQ-binding-like beta-propeller repeat protein [Bdellovibrionales bacterium]
MRLWLVLLLLIPMAACSGKGETDKITGERVPVLRPAAALKADTSMEGSTLSIGDTLANDAWPQSMGAADGSFGNLAFTKDPKEVWRASVGGSSKRIKLLSRPIIGDGKVFVMDTEANAHAFSLKDGAQLWAHDLAPEDIDEQIFGGGLAYDKETLYATTAYGDVLALKAADGKVIWRTNVRDVMRGAPLVAGGRVYAMSVGGQLHALDVATGKELWIHSGISEASALLGASTPVLAGDVVIASYNSGEIYAVRAQNGRTMWTQSLTASRLRSGAPALSDIKASPAVVGDRAYSISYGGRMAAIDVRSGNAVWDADIGGVNSPVVAGDVVFVLADGSALATLERSSGRTARVVQLQRWADIDDEEGSLAWAGPVMGEGLLWLVNSEGELKGYEASSGTEAFSADLPGKTLLPPVLAQKTLVILTDDGTLVAYR